MEYFVFHTLSTDTTQVDLFGAELLSIFEAWRMDTHSSFGERMNESTLIKKIKTEIDLPFDAIEELPRTAAGIKKRYFLVKIGKHMGVL